MLKPVSEVTRENSGWNPDWISGQGDLVLYNPRFGWVQHVVVCDANGRPRFDQAMLAARPGVVCVVIDEGRRLAVLKHYRPICAPSSVPTNGPIRDFPALGVESMEFPRGGVENGETPLAAAAREVEEEIGYCTRSAVLLDPLNGDTAFFPYSSFTCLVEIDLTRKSLREADPMEEIEVQWLTIKDFLAMIGSGAVLCAQTKAAFISYLAYLSRTSPSAVMIG